MGPEEKLLGLMHISFYSFFFVDGLHFWCTQVFFDGLRV
jgi:hypothetical protein